MLRRRSEVGRRVLHQQVERGKVCSYNFIRVIKSVQNKVASPNSSLRMKHLQTVKDSTEECERQSLEEKHSLRSQTFESREARVTQSAFTRQVTHSLSISQTFLVVVPRQDVLARRYGFRLVTFRA